MPTDDTLPDKISEYLAEAFHGLLSAEGPKTLESFEDEALALAAGRGGPVRDLGKSGGRQEDRPEGGPLHPPRARLAPAQRPRGVRAASKVRRLPLQLRAQRHGHAGRPELRLHARVHGAHRRSRGHPVAAESRDGPRPGSGGRRVGRARPQLRGAHVR